MNKKRSSLPTSFVSSFFFMGTCCYFIYIFCLLFHVFLFVYLHVLSYLYLHNFDVLLLFYVVFVLFCSDPNKHLCLWLQQFWAMFLKRFYTSIRFYPALITQFLLPVLFVVFGLLVVVTSPDRANDPPRALLLSNSGLDSRNTTLFFAEFEGSVGLSVRNYNVFTIVMYFGY